MSRLPWASVGQALWAGALDLLWPVSCPICQQWIQGGRGVIESPHRATGPLLHARCLAGLERAGWPCPRPRPLVEGIPVWWAYVDTPRFFRVLHAAKYGHRPDLLAALAQCPSIGIVSHAPAGRILVPLPDDARRRSERGYSVTLTVASALAARLHGVVRSDLLVRRRPAPAQATLADAAARRANVAGLFGVGRLAEVDPRAELVLVEDQVTTGSTLAAAARLLGARGHPVLALALGGARDAPRQVVA